MTDGINWLRIIPLQVGLDWGGGAAGGDKECSTYRRC